MPQCLSCSAPLQPEGNFCIRCGEPTSAAVSRPEPLPAPGTNSLAILALVLAAIGGPPALIFGHVALVQINETGERGRGMAVTATILGYVWLVVWAILLYSLLTTRA